MGHPPAQAHDVLDVEPIDPLHDIDGKRTVSYTFIGFAILFVSMWLLHLLFAVVLDQEYGVKVADRETIELNALRIKEQAELAKTEDLGDGFQRISIDEAIRRLSTK
jgi:hypothetical protein